MKRKIMNNLDLCEPICIDENNNALSEYEAGREFPGKIALYENGYAYLVDPETGTEQEGPCMKHQDWQEYANLPGVTMEA